MAHAIIEKLKYDLVQNCDKEPKISVLQAVLHARAHRMGMVQITVIFLNIMTHNEVAIYVCVSGNSGEDKGYFEPA